MSTSQKSLNAFAKDASSTALAAASAVRGSATVPAAHHAPTRTPSAAIIPLWSLTSRMAAITVRSTKGLLVERLVLRDDLVHAVALAGILRRAARHALPPGAVAEEVHGCARHRVDVTDRAEDPGLAVTHDFWQATRA